LIPNLASILSLYFLVYSAPIPNVANLFTWFALVKMGYDTKVGYSKDKIYLLAIMKHKLYQVAFFKLKGKKYYVLTPNGRVGKVGKIYTYKGNYPKADDKLSFDINKEIKFYSNIKKKDLKFKYYGKNYSVASSYSKDLVDFYGTFPQSDYNIYFNTKNSAPLSNSILRQLQEILKGKSELEAVNILLRFTQTAFAYKTDQKQFDYEKVMFPEETVFYPYSDCEDRSIMFSFLVKNILGLDVVGVKYPDHMATAVEFSSKVSGDGFNYKNKKYVISDPTYVNANAGMAMPQYKNRKFEVISLR
jgi:NifU-like protein involved in Fe-S cluster formation